MGNQIEGGGLAKEQALSQKRIFGAGSKLQQEGGDQVNPNREECFPTEKKNIDRRERTGPISPLSKFDEAGSLGKTSVE